MPKVKDEYLENKRNQILDAAFEVCKRKPAYDVTMTDIVTETGMSQGGVYKYFNNIDLVLAALIDKANLQGNYIGQIDEIMKSGKNPDTILHSLFLVSEQYFSEMLISYNKILFELSTFFVYNPKRKEQINKNVTTSSTFEYLTQCASAIIIAGAFLFYALSHNEELYKNIICPLAVIFGYGTLSIMGEYSSINFTSFGISVILIRSLAGLALGSLIYYFASHLKEKHYPLFSKSFLTIINLLFIIYFINIVFC